MYLAFSLDFLFERVTSDFDFDLTMPRPSLKLSTLYCTCAATPKVHCAGFDVMHLCWNVWYKSISHDGVVILHQPPLEI